MIAIVCPGHPEKRMTTRLTPLGDDRWEVDLEGALDVLWDAENGAADELARALGLPETTIAAAWKRHQARWVDS